MGKNQSPNLGKSKICYIEIPAIDIERSVSFYKEVFGWNIRRRGDGHVAFDDVPTNAGPGEISGTVSGTWELGRKPMTEPGLLVYIMVDDPVAAVEAIVASGGAITRPISEEGPVALALFTDPAGNVMGIFKER